MKNQVAVLLLALLTFSPLWAQDVDTSNWNDTKYIAEITSAYNQAQSEFKAYEAILVDYRPSSKAAQDQFQKIIPPLTRYYTLLESWEKDLNAYGHQMIKDGMYAKSPKVIAVLNKIKQVKKAKGKYSIEQLPSAASELKRLFTTQLVLGDSVRASSLGTSSSRRKAGDRMVKKIRGLEFAFRYCPAGSFMMGSPEDEKGRDSDEIQHEVTLSKGFWMMETEVTQKQWRTVMGNNPSRFSGDNLPVEKVSWDDCQEFCQKAKSLGLPVCLPTEAQWEYACRAGTTGAQAGDLDAMAWYGSNSGSKTHPVGTKQPNAWGLYDMHGNVWEWCSDWYGDYPYSAVTDPVGSKNGSDRVNRGGCWYLSAGYCRSASRNRVTPGYRDGSLGFRCCVVQ